MKQIKLTDAIGRELTGVHWSKGNRELALVFEDDFALLAPFGSGDSPEIEDNYNGFSWRSFGEYESLAAGLVTQEEVDAYNAERERRYRAEQEKRDRNEYERLKAKFGGGR